jgi:hypothetical protein
MTTTELDSQAKIFFNRMKKFNSENKKGLLLLEILTLLNETDSEKIRTLLKEEPEWNHLCDSIKKMDIPKTMLIYGKHGKEIINKKEAELLLDALSSTNATIPLHPQLN